MVLEAGGGIEDTVHSLFHMLLVAKLMVLVDATEKCSLSWIERNVQEIICCHDAIKPCLDVPRKRKVQIVMLSAIDHGPSVSEGK